MSKSRSSRAMQVVLGLYFLEAGLFLILAPWSRFWIHRVVLPAPVSFEPLLMCNSFRGFVTGIGVLHLILASRELLGWKEEPA